VPKGAPKGAPKRLQRGAKRLQRGAKEVPKRCQRGSKEVPKRLQRGAKRLQRGAKEAPTDHLFQPKDKIDYLKDTSFIPSLLYLQPTIKIEQYYPTI
jgi:hypothetical protein